MSTFAIVHDDGIVVNVATCDNAEWAAEQGWIDITNLDPRPWIGWAHDDGKWTAPEPSPDVPPLAVPIGGN